MVLDNVCLQSTPADAPIRHEAKPTSALHVLKGIRAVIAEDQGVTQLHLTRILTDADIEVVGTVGNGLDAVEMVASTAPDIVLMDVQMPVMDGLHAAKLILMQVPVCVVMLTAYLDSEQTTEATAAGVAGFITKPVSAVTLIPLLEELFAAYTNG